MKKTNVKNTASMTSKTSKTQNHTETMKKTATGKTATKQFSYEQKFASPGKLKIHPILEAIGYDQPDAMFTENIKFFNYLERPVVTEDGFVVTHPTDVIAAQNMKKKQVEIVMMKGATVDDVIRFISFKNVWVHGRSRKNIYRLIEFLSNHLKNNENGKEWAKELAGSKTRKKIAAITGLSDGTIQNISRIGKNKPELLDEIDNGNLTSSQVQEEIIGEAAMNARKVHGGIKLSNKKGTESYEAKYNLKSICLDIDKIGKLEYTIHGDKVVGALNGIKLEETSHSVEADNETEGQRDPGQHHVMLPVNDKYAVHIILRNIDAISEEIKLAA